MLMPAVVPAGIFLIWNYAGWCEI